MTMLHSSCVTVEQSLHPALTRCLRALLGHAHTLRGVPIHEWVRRQRLEPLIYGVGGPVDDFFTAAFLDECRQAYINLIGRSHYFLREADRVTARLRAYAIDSLAWRGSVYSRDLYGDAGLRYGTDLDILVSPADRLRALRILIDAGYHLRERAPPVWFLLRHHLHWPILSPDGRVPIDVHWAVDHPYSTGPHVAADVFLNSRNPVAATLLAALHAEKESRLRTCNDEDELRDRIFRKGPVWPWLDLALMVDTVMREGRERELEQLAEAHGAAALIQRVRAVVSNWFGVRGHTAFTFVPGRKRRTVADDRWAIRLAERIGCRTEVLLDWVDYIRDPRSWLERAIRCLKVLRLAGDVAVCGLYEWGKGRRNKRPRSGASE